MNISSSFTIIVPAGGRGTRLEAMSLTRLKTTLPFFGRTVLEYALQPCLEAGGRGCAIVVVADRCGESVKAALNSCRRRVRVVADGNLSSVIATAPGDVLVLPGDTILDSDGLRRFIARARTYPAAVLVREFADYKGRSRLYPLPKRKFVFIEATLGTPPMGTDLARYPKESYDRSPWVLAGGVAYLRRETLPSSFPADPYAITAKLIAAGTPIACLRHNGFFCDLDDFGDFKEVHFKTLRLFGQRLRASRVSPRARVDAAAVITGPVEVEAGAVIEAHTRIEGPVHIGSGTVVKAGSFVSHSWIGRHCRIGPNTCVHVASFADRSTVGQGCDFCGIALERARILGPGCFTGLVGAGAVLFPNSTIGDHPVDNRSVRTICGAEIQDTGWNSLGPLVADGAIIGPNAKLMPGRHIGAGAIVDPNVVVIRNVPPRMRAHLVPSTGALEKQKDSA